MKRRSLKELWRAVENATRRTTKALALYELAVFHDNNSREAEAIPLYQMAIRFGLSRKYEAMARAWLASSLYKTGRSREAQKQISAASKLAQDPRLKKFQAGLLKRIEKKAA